MGAKLSKIIDRNFNAWIDVPTWHTNHPADDERFYRFVWAVVSYSRSRRPSEADIRELIQRRWVGQLEHQYLEAKAQRYANLYESLYEFGKVRR